ncbi:luciferase domain-containing protein [Haloarchaeobius amylolyticus]|uniref:luciferase domain-containing protein n=1 Tax=Haloarchaeobius amylolyticus TaxID=1198296 RepID=UPI0022720124|nr:luciferase family protein [Haloarchaeobius amylolyticus]
MRDAATDRDSGEFIAAICDEVTTWPAVTDGDHRDGGREFHCDTQELGHIHRSGLVDVEYRLPVRDAVLAEGLAEPHSLAPRSGWTSFRVAGGDDLDHAVLLLRISYLDTLLTRSHTHTCRAALDELDVDAELDALPGLARAELERLYTELLA